MTAVRAKSAPLLLYGLLVLYAAVSITYYVAGVMALREEWFHSTRYAADPLHLADDNRTVTNPGKQAKDAGIRPGDVVETFNRSPYTGFAQFNDYLRHSKPGDVMQLRVQHRDGREQDAQFRLQPMEGPHFTLGGYIAILTPVLLVPLLGLVVGYWVVAARPRDPSAWLVLVLLSFTETAFGNLDWSFRPGIWFALLGTWSLTLQMLVFPALLWFGLLFPERSRIDVRWPWLKWVITCVQFLDFGATLWTSYLRSFHINEMRFLPWLQLWLDRLSGAVAVVCVVLFLVAIFDKLRSASTPDARRRLRVLAVGSGISLGPLLIIFAVLPHFGIELTHGAWFMAIVPLVVIFPLTLAYVVVVQRAMDLRILLRMGTKYLLAKATLIIIQIAVATWIVFALIIPVIQRHGHKSTYVVLALALAVVVLRISGFGRRISIGSRLHEWIDRKFFREAYDAEVVLSELSENARRFTERVPLIETISRRISEVLHVPQVAVWLRGSNVFQLQQAVGVHLLEPVLLPERSATVQNLARTNRPATVYRDRPAEWLMEAGPDERQALDAVNAELLLPLPGRERLLGMMSLGPKRSEEPYTPTDLRVLQSVAAQTGLALEVSELAHSLANEAAQRERINREMEIAREVQQRLFPQRLPCIPGLSLAGMCRPALGVGGDYYDFIELEDGRIGIAIGDVSGKGISAALLMASLRASLRGMTLEGPSDLAKTMVKVNRLVYEASANNRYATFFFATYNPAICELRYVNAGHNPPVLLRGSSGEPLPLEAGGLVVGLLPEAPYEEQPVRMEPGDVLIAYTDGISEAMTADDEEWGEERMLEAARRAQKGSAQEILQAIFRAADEFTAAAPQHDDMTLLVMKLDACGSKV
jgi:phosphoserine phosphatase RsbU/P